MTRLLRSSTVAVQAVGRFCSPMMPAIWAGGLAVDGGDYLLRRGAGLCLVLHLLGPGELPDEDDGEQKHRHQQRRPIGHQVLAKRTIALSHHRLERRTLPPDAGRWNGTRT